LKPIALIDSNIIVYAMVKDYSDNRLHHKCLEFIEKGLTGKLDYALALDPIIVAETFSILRKTLDCDDAEFRVNTLLRSDRITFYQPPRKLAKTLFNGPRRRTCQLTTQ